MDSALTPREIQSRIRAGASVDDVAQAAGVPPERVEPFAGPVLAEREFIAGLARGHHVRRGGQTVPHRTLADIVADRVSARGVDPDTLVWDSWKHEGRKWVVQVSYETGNTHRAALFLYDQDGRFSVPTNDDARWLVGFHGAQPERRREEAEPTVDLNGQLALVRVVQPPAEFELAEDTLRYDPQSDDEAEGDYSAEGDDDDLSDAEDAYTDTELAEVDGVLEFVPHSQMDVLYDMLSSFDEDSVQIYSGLVTPLAPDDVVVNDEETRHLRRGHPSAPHLVEQPVDADGDPSPEPPDQPSLIDDDAPVASKRPRRAARRRASVPSWDEIVFGSPKGKN